MSSLYEKGKKEHATVSVSHLDYVAWDRIKGEENTRNAKKLFEDGYVIIEDALTPDQIHAVRSAVDPRLNALEGGRNTFEGHATKRIYNCVGQGKILEDIAEHPKVLGVFDGFMDPGYLLSASLAIQIMPGEKQQPLHFDDGFYPLNRPRPPMSIATVWAIDEFTENNGATVVYPGSHRWGSQMPPGVAVNAVDFRHGSENPENEGKNMDNTVHDARIVKAVMKPGSVVLFVGTLWHAGGANNSDAPRLGLSNQYCQPYLRQQEQFVLSNDPEHVLGMSPRVKGLLGYSVIPPFMGHVAGYHPLNSLKKHGAGEYLKQSQGATYSVRQSKI
eukprot:Clim_evm6s36 gene=Clim_evmTU6s36